MRRSVAKRIHESTNIAYWMENPNWDPGNAAFRLVCEAFRKMPFSLHEAQKRTFFDANRLIAVNGETVVAANGADKVDKFMFRYPGKMKIETFKEHVAHEVCAMTSCLVDVALPTDVVIKPADIFKYVRRPVPTVTQTQQRLDLTTHKALDLNELEDEATSPKRDKTARDLERMLKGIDYLAEGYGFLPDIANNSGNLRRSVLDGTVTLIDVMPIYLGGDRLIADHPNDLVGNTVANIRNYRSFIGQYGA